MAGSKKVVVDASVVFKWFVEEQDSGVAKVLAGDYGGGRVDIASVELLPARALEEELERRTLGGEAVLSLDDDLASIMTSSCLKLLSTLTRLDGAHSVRELALKLKRPEKSVSRDVEVLARHVLIITRDVSDCCGRRREIRVGVSKLILVPDTKSVSVTPEAASTTHP